jgi:hypothetical protein
MTTPTPTPARPVKGQTVWVLDPETDGPSTKFPGPWRLDRINAQSYSLVQPVEGEPRRHLRAGKSVVVTEEPAGQPGVIDWREPWVQGTLVRWHTNTPPKAGTDLFVVISDSGLAAVKLVPLGNACGRVWGKAPVKFLTKVDPAEVLR